MLTKNRPVVYSVSKKKSLWLHQGVECDLYKRLDGTRIPVEFRPHHHALPGIQHHIRQELRIVLRRDLALGLPFVDTLREHGAQAVQPVFEREPEALAVAAHLEDRFGQETLAVKGMADQTVAHRFQP